MNLREKYKNIAGTGTAQKSPTEVWDIINPNDRIKVNNAIREVNKYIKDIELINNKNSISEKITIQKYGVLLKYVIEYSNKYLPIFNSQEMEAIIQLDKCFKEIYPNSNDTFKMVTELYYLDYCKYNLF